MKNLSVIVPIFNFEKKIKNNLFILNKKLKKTIKKYEIIAINDGSRDRTLEYLKKTKKKIKNLLILNNKKNRGKSHSLRKGILSAKYDKIILIDCDLPYLNKFNKVVKNILNGYDLVFIDRRNKKSKLVKKDLNFYKILRVIIGTSINLLVKKIIGLNIPGGDTQAGLKAFKKDNNFSKINFISNKFFLDLEIMYYYKNMNKKFLSIPVKYSLDNYSSIKLFSYKNIEILFELIKVILKIKKNIK